MTPWSGGVVSDRATCVLAPNPSPMTLDGTNTWVLAEPGSRRCVVLDPGPLDETHLDAVRAAVADQDTRRWTRTVAGTTLAVLATAVAGSIATDPTSRWYRSLDLPAIQPPAWVFPVVWTALYADIAAVSSLSLADLAETDRHDQWRAYAAALGTNLALNAGWSAVFFRGHRPGAATVVAAALAASSADLTRRAWSVSPEKGVVLAPYAAWTAFATVLTAAIARRNR